MLRPSATLAQWLSAKSDFFILTGFTKGRTAEGKTQGRGRTVKIRVMFTHSISNHVQKVEHVLGWKIN
ncbi:hypothetical protein BLX87_21300 [Bacillus sp. VT-16-64]|nr:hypothetical protein BLX87_21300 [Bacillus sp. VT-16-64]